MNWQHFFSGMQRGCDNNSIQVGRGDGSHLRQRFPFLFGSRPRVKDGSGMAPLPIGVYLPIKIGAIIADSLTPGP